MTFQETRTHLGVETQRQWSDLAIQRTMPVLMGMFSLCGLVAKTYFQQGRLTPKTWAWYRKQEVTFSDIMAVIRRNIWTSKYLNSQSSPQQKVFSQEDLNTLIDQLLDAA